MVSIVTRYVTCNTDCAVIKGFRHKGLQTFFETGSKKGIQPKHANHLRDILATLDSATSPKDIEAPNFRLHLLEPHRANVWSVYVAKNWSVDFRFIGGHAEAVDYVDHH